MRYSTVRGLDDGLNIDLGGDVSIICAIMEIGVAEDALVYKAELTGAELTEFFSKFNLLGDYGDEIKPENRYILTAYDW